MEYEFIKVQTWQIMISIGKEIDDTKAEYAYFDELYKHMEKYEYLTHIRAVQLSYLVDSTMFIEDRKIFVEGMVFASKALNILDNNKESSLLTKKEKIKQIKGAYEEIKKDGKYSNYNEFDDCNFKRGIKKYVKRYCKKSNN